MIIPFANNQSGTTGISLPIPFDEYAKNTADSVNYSNVSFRSFSQIPISEDPYCESPEFLESQIPFWIKQNYTNSEESYLIAFIKSYYNWLYCGFKNNETQITPYDMELLFDIDQAPDAFIDYYVKTYAPFIELESPVLKRENLRKFINNIKTKFLSSKGIKGSYDYILNTLFGITLENISYPKVAVFRLNGGKFDFYTDGPDTFSNINNLLFFQESEVINSVPQLLGHRINSPGLNKGVIQDNVFWNDYSYIMQTSASTEESIYYTNTILKSVHPAGTKAFFEQYVPVLPLDFGTIDANTYDAEPPVVIGELPIIRNYLLYYPNYSFSSAGITFCNCCSSYCDPTGNTGYFPVHADPRWSTSISDSIQTFGQITIGDFIELIPIEDSPNPATTDCTSCGA